MTAVLVRAEGGVTQRVLVHDDETVLVTDPLSWRWVAEVDDEEQGRALIELLGRKHAPPDVRVRRLDHREAQQG